MKIIYSLNALESLQEIVDFLNYNWTIKELNVFKTDLEKFLNSFDDHIISYPKLNPDSDLKFAFLGKKQVKVYFDQHSDFVEILLFLPSKGDPKTLENLLK